MKILIDTDTIKALISWIPNEGDSAAKFVNEVLALIAPKKPEIVQSFRLAFDAEGDPSDIAKLAGMAGCAVATLSWWPTEIFVVANVPDEFVGKVISLKREEGVEYDAAKVLEMVEAKFAEAKK